MTDIEKVARAIWNQQRNHWGHYRDMVPDLCEWEELTQSKQRELMREAQAAIAAMQPAPQWQGIETAPRDWTDVLVFSPEHSGFNCAGVFSAFYDTDHPGWFANGPSDNIPLTPTHWMPLPTPPAGGSDAER